LTWSHFNGKKFGKRGPTWILVILGSLVEGKMGTPFEGLVRPGFLEKKYPPVAGGLEGMVKESLWRPILIANKAPSF
jgi:hypothetical protein